HQERRRWVAVELAPRTLPAGRSVLEGDEQHLLRPEAKGWAKRRRLAQASVAEKLVADFHRSKEQRDGCRGERVLGTDDRLARLAVWIAAPGRHAPLRPLDEDDRVPTGDLGSCH